MNPPSLSIVLPCFNPPKHWSENILSELEWLKKELPEENIRLFVVNDGTTSQTLGTNILLGKEGIVFIQRNENKGKGYTLREGVGKTESAKVVYTDIDFPYERQSLLAVIRALDQSDVAIGVRSEEYYHNMPPIRVWVSKGLRLCIRLFLRIPTDDTQCGLKGFNTKGKTVFLSTTIDRYLFDLEFVFLASREKLNIQKVPVRLKEGIFLSNLNFEILWREARNFLKVFVTAIFKTPKSKT